MFSRFIKSSKSCLSLSGNLIDFFEQALKFDWSSCFNKAGKKMPLRAQNEAICENKVRCRQPNRLQRSQVIWKWMK